MSVQAIAASSSNGVSVSSNGSAHTKGNYAQLFASLTDDTSELHLIFNNSSNSNRHYLVDIAIGASSSEVVLIPNIGIRNLNANKYVVVKLGVDIAAGTRVSARCQDATGGGAIRISGVALAKSSGDLRTGVSSSSDWVNPLADTATSTYDVSVDGGGSANTYSGSAGNICNADAPIAATHMIVTTRDAASASGADAMARIKLNGSVITGVENLYHKTVNADGSMRYHGPFKLPTAVAVNDTITAEVSSNTTTVGGRELSVGVILINFPAASGGTGTIIQGAAMQRAMRDAETTASRKRLFFDIRDSAGAAWAGSVTGLKAQLSISGATEASSTNDIVRVAGAVHYVELSDAEAASATAGDVIAGRVAATTGRLESVSYLEITADDITTPALTATDIANAVVEAEADALETYDRTTNTAATITTPTSGARTLTIATDAAYEPIKSIA